MGKARRLDDRQRVHVGAQADGAVALPAADHADHARLGDASDDLVDAELAQQGGDPRGGARQVKAQFGMGVEILPPAGDFRLQFGKAVLDGHWRYSSGMRRSARVTNQLHPTGMMLSSKS